MFRTQILNIENSIISFSITKILATKFTIINLKFFTALISNMFQHVISEIIIWNSDITYIFDEDHLFPSTLLTSAILSVMRSVELLYLQRVRISACKILDKSMIQSCLSFSFSLWFSFYHMLSRPLPLYSQQIKSGELLMLLVNRPSV